MSGFEQAISDLAQWFPPGTFYANIFNIYATIGIVLTCLTCGGIGGLVVGNRMAFFSDALAHCAFAGVSLGLLLSILAGVPDASVRELVLLIMVLFGVMVGLAIAWVRDRTGLASDTVIGVFFAFAIGIGAIIPKLLGQRVRFSIESFIFGNPIPGDPLELLYLAILLIVTAAFLIFFYNDLVLSSVHPSLARSRNVRVRLLRYLLIVLLGVLVNVCLHIVGTLLINGLLIVPAAAASNLSRNLRQLFWWTLALTLTAGLGGQWLAWEINEAFHAQRVSVGIGGTIIVLCCLFFFASMALRPWVRGRSALTVGA
jgi:zinc transport system permease protein